MVMSDACFFGRGVKTALLKGENRVDDYLVTVICTQRVNTTVIPLQQRAFYPRSCLFCPYGNTVGCVCVHIEKTTLKIVFYTKIFYRFVSRS